MKICAVICEYNPFHNGHAYQLVEAKARSGADALLCIMSGNFVQRGEAAILNKFIRAKHAVMGGADAVIELPTLFASANAELFAKGAISILSSIPNVTTLCFGSETADSSLFYKAAQLLNDEPKEVSEKIKSLISTGISYAKARAEAWKNILPFEILNAPNNILGVEYTRSILQKGANIEILPIQRIGGGYSDKELNTEFSSASAIRNAIQNGTTISEQLPLYVKTDLPKTIDNQLEILEKYAILLATNEELKEISDCTEGLENALKKAVTSPVNLVENLTSARYTSSRIRRIALHSLLKIKESIIRESLSQPLYLRILAAKKTRSDLL
ncbi:MAG: nucleotidyltransferase family protein, partial [Clostridia bacterium]|nr:nucleotidyltransferase family protein [Clostridia bacterium]